MKRSSSSKEEGRRLAEDITSMYSEGQLDISRAVYQEVHDTVDEIQEEGDKDPTQFNYRFHIVAIPYHEDFIRQETVAEQLKCEFIGFINSSLSAASDQGSLFDGYYSWVKKGKNDYSSAHDITGVLTEYGFVFGINRKSKSKVPCVIAANLESEKFHYQNTAKQSRIDTTHFRDGIIKAVEKLAKKVHTFQSIGIRFLTDKEQYELTNVSRGARTSIKDIVEMMLLTRIETVQAGGTITTEQTQDSLWYNALPKFEEYNVKYSNDSRAHFKNCIRQLCKEHDIAREQIGIIASPWGSMFFKGEWFDISFDTIEHLAENGTDIIFIEKRDIVRALGKYASKKGVALVNTHGLLSDYTEDLAELADRVGAHIALLTDYDIPGLLIASKLSENVPRLGVDERMLRYFGISHENTRLVIPYNAKIPRLKEHKLRALINNDKRFNPDDVDIDFLKYHKIEIDAILAEVGAERLWNYLQDLLEQEFPTRDYTRVIDPAPDLSKHYPPIVQQLKLYYDKVASEITKAESEKIEEELEDVEGFIDVEKKEKEILDDRLGKIVKEDKHLTEVAEAFVKLAEERGYKIMELEIAKEGVPKNESSKHQDVSSTPTTDEEDIPPPDPEITDKDIEMSQQSNGREDPLTWAKFGVINDYCSDVGLFKMEEIMNKLMDDTDIHCYALVEHGRIEIMEKMQKEGGCKDAIADAYKEVMKRIKQEELMKRIKNKKEDQDIPEPPITKLDRQACFGLDVKDFVKYRYMKEHGAPRELMKRIEEESDDEEADYTWSEAVNDSWKQYVRMQRKAMGPKWMPR